MKVLILGATGGAGREIVRQAGAQGHQVVLTDLSGVHGGTVARGDVAKFLVQQLTDDSWLRRAPLITW